MVPPCRAAEAKNFERCHAYRVLKFSITESRTLKAHREKVIDLLERGKKWSAIPTATSYELDQRNYLGKLDQTKIPYLDEMIFQDFIYFSFFLTTHTDESLGGSRSGSMFAHENAVVLIRGFVRARKRVCFHSLLSR